MDTVKKTRKGREMFLNAFKSEIFPLPPTEGIGLPSDFSQGYS